MTDNLKQFIAERKWRDMDSCPKDEPVLLKQEHLVFSGCFDHGVKRWAWDYGMQECLPDGWLPLTPDNRLADIALELLECVEEWEGSAKDLLNEKGGGEHGRGMKTFAGFLKESLSETLNKVNKIMGE